MMPCTACSVGKYKNNFGTETCTHCLQHATTLSAASTSVSACVCSAGFEMINGHCEHCAAGFFKGVPGSGKCVDKCPEFSSSPEGSTLITDCECEAGYTGVAANAMCNACALGTYKTDRGSAECVACTANATMLTVTSTYARDCSCSVSFSSSHACRLLFTEECRCTECPANYYGTHNDCLSCPENTESQPASK